VAELQSQLAAAAAERLAGQQAASQAAAASEAHLAAAAAELKAAQQAAAEAAAASEAKLAAAAAQAEALAAQLGTVQEDAAAAKGLVTAERERNALLEKARAAGVQVRWGGTGGPL
jgi:hypothetical protein